MSGKYRAAFEGASSESLKADSNKHHWHKKATVINLRPDISTNVWGSFLWDSWQWNWRSAFFYGVIQLWQTIAAVNAWERFTAVDANNSSWLMCCSRNEGVLIEEACKNQTGLSPTKPRLKDGRGLPWTLLQPFYFSPFKQLLDLLHSFPQIKRPSALPQSDSCPKAKAANAEPDGWCVLICGPSDLYRGVKPSVF